jgi:hypothetical protein
MNVPADSLEVASTADTQLGRPYVSAEPGRIDERFT